MSTPADFVKGLNLLRVEAGQPPLRELSRSTGIPRSTLALIFDQRRGQLPPLERCFAVLTALGVAEPQLAEWAAAWKRIEGAALLQAEAPDPEPEAGSGPDVGREAAAVDETPGRRSHRSRLVLAFALGFALAVGTTLTALHLLKAPVPPAPLLVGDYAVCQPGDFSPSPSSARPSPPPTLPAVTGAGLAHPISWIARPAYDARIESTTQVSLPITTAVADGHALIVTMMLTSTCPGQVTVTDSQDNHYRTVADVTDVSRHRVLIIAAFDVDALGTADSIKISYPKASKYHVAVDEFSGLSAADQAATASGTAGGPAFTTSGAPLTCTDGGLQVAAIGTNSGDAPSPAIGWTVVPPVLKLSSYRLTTAYRLTRATGPCALTGSTTAQWAAALATFH